MSTWATQVDSGEVNKTERRKLKVGDEYVKNTLYEILHRLIKTFRKDLSESFSITPSSTAMMSLILPCTYCHEIYDIYAFKIGLLLPIH